MQTITPQELKTAIDEGSPITLIDLQDAHEYAHRHIPNAINMPDYGTCGEECARLLRDKDAHIVVYGAMDELGAGAKAIETLERADYTNVSRLLGGLVGWMEAGFTVEGGAES